MTTPGGYSTGTPGIAPSVLSLAIQASTPVAGFPLQNATPTILSWTAPNDGKLHYAQLLASVSVTTVEVGGAVAFNWTSGGIAISHQAFPGGAGTGSGAGPANTFTVAVDPGTTVSLTQSSALTSGVASIFAAIFGA